MTVKVSPKFQVVIPEEVRKSVGIAAGMEVNVINKGGVIYIIPIKSLDEIAKSFEGRFAADDAKGFREKRDRTLK